MHRKTMKTQFIINRMLKDEIEENNQLNKKILKIKIKIIRIKIEIQKVFYL